MALQRDTDSQSDENEARHLLHPAPDSGTSKDPTEPSDQGGDEEEPHSSFHHVDRGEQQADR